MSLTARPVVFADTFHLPRVSSRVRAALLVLAFALFTAAMAQVRIPLGFTPVPITGQTLAVLLAGGVLGARMGAASQVTYLALGLFLPFYAGGESGWTYASGATGGYLVGMVLAAYVVGMLAERREDRSFVTSVAAMVLGSVIVYVVGTPWLAAVANLSAGDAVVKGVAPFLIGDAFKALVAGAALPLAWKLTHSNNN